MSDPLVTVALDGNRRMYRPGDILSGEYCIKGVDPSDIVALELSVVWYSEGKGDDDLDVHLFLRFSVEDGDRLDPREPGRFSTQLPSSPLSYNGVIVKIRWCVRVRVYLLRRKELLKELPFKLGDIPDARAVLP